MALLGSMNHVSVTVADLDGPMRFYGPFLEFLGYELGEPIRDPNGQRLRVNVNRHNGAVLNLWEAKPELAAHRFEPYEVGLHHLAFNTGTREQVEEACAVYFLGPDGLKPRSCTSRAQCGATAR